MPDDDEHSGNTTVPTPEGAPAGTSSEPPPPLAFVILAYPADPSRVGQVGVLGVRNRPYNFGRDDSSELPRLRFGDQRPGESMGDGGPLQGTERALSRAQLHLVAKAHGIEVTVTGGCPTFVNGERIERTKKTLVVPGDVVCMKGQLLLSCVRRGRLPPPAHFPEAARGRFGEPDALGIVGESFAVWALREDIARAAKLNAPVLIHGESGSGKELVARGIHRLSPRAGRPFVPCNCAAFPSTLAESELFGLGRDSLGPRMAEREGYFGQAEGGTLFLDEIGELSTEAQAVLLRALDKDGEYKRLGDTKLRRAQVLLVAATNRPLSRLRHDLFERFVAVIEVPSLGLRREDIPLLVRHLLLTAEAKGNEIAKNALRTHASGWRYGDVSESLLEQLVHGDYPGNVRGLERDLFRGLQGKTTGTVAAAEEEDVPGVDELLAALEGARGNKTKAAEKLKVSRQKLYRALKEHGLDDEEDE